MKNNMRFCFCVLLCLGTVLQREASDKGWSESPILGTNINPKQLLHRIGQNIVADKCVGMLENPDAVLFGLPNWGCSITNKEVVKFAVFATTTPIINVLSDSDKARSRTALINAVTVPDFAEGLIDGAKAIVASKVEQVCWWLLGAIRMQNMTASFSNNHPIIAGVGSHIVRSAIFLEISSAESYLNEKAAACLADRGS
jgi:hypothetical protein